MNSSNIIHKFNENTCELNIPITKRVQVVQNLDIFIDEYDFVLVADIEIRRFKCPRQFDLMDMRNIAISFNTKQWEYSCILPCYPEEPKNDKIESVEQEKINSRNIETEEARVLNLTRITDSCVLSVDGNICKIQADFPYGFSGRYRGKPKYNENDLSHICRITNPSHLSSINRKIQREKDEVKDFCPDQYKLNFVELQIPEGHENPIKYTISYDDTELTYDEKSILENIKLKQTAIDVKKDQIDIDCGLVSILFAICYDVRLTSNDPTCESPWTRTSLSSTLSYFERFENLTSVVESFIRRSLIYPLYRNYDLSSLCIQDAIEAMQKGKHWILKQLFVTYNCFMEGDFDRKALNKYFIKHYIWYVEMVLDNDHLQMLSRNVKNVFLNTNKKHLRLGLGEIETELLKELIDDIHLRTSSESEGEVVSSSEGSKSSAESESESESETDDSDNGDSGSVIEKKI